MPKKKTKEESISALAPAQELEIVLVAKSSSKKAAPKSPSKTTPPSRPVAPKVSAKSKTEVQQDALSKKAAKSSKVSPVVVTENVAPEPKIEPKSELALSVPETVTKTKKISKTLEPVMAEPQVKTPSIKTASKDGAKKDVAPEVKAKSVKALGKAKSKAKTEHVVVEPEPLEPEVITVSEPLEPEAILEPEVIAVSEPLEPEAILEPEVIEAPKPRAAKKSVKTKPSSAVILEVAAEVIAEPLEEISLEIAPEVIPEVIPEIIPEVIPTLEGKKAPAKRSAAKTSKTKAFVPLFEEPIAPEPVLEEGVPEKPVVSEIALEELVLEAEPVEPQVAKKSTIKGGRKPKAAPALEPVTEVMTEVALEPAFELILEPEPKSAAKAKTAKPRAKKVKESIEVVIEPVALEPIHAPISGEVKPILEPVLEPALEPAVQSNIQPAVQSNVQSTAPSLETAPTQPSAVSKPTRAEVSQHRSARQPRAERSVPSVAPTFIASQKPIPEKQARAEQMPETLELSDISEVPEIPEVAPDTRDPQAVLLEFFRKNPRPWHIRDLERNLPKLDRTLLGSKRDLESQLEVLTHDGVLIKTRNRTYGLVASMDLVKGRFQANSSGFGFVIREEGGTDLYIPRESTLSAWNGDTVLARMDGQRKGEDSPRGSIARVIQRASLRLVGTLEYSKGYAILHPDDPKMSQRILLLPDGLEDLRGGARVVALLFYPEDTGEDEVYGEIVEVLGKSDSPEVETTAVMLKYDLKSDFSELALQQAEAILLLIPESALEGRLDLRERRIFTVDGRDAKDFDDAIHIEALDEGGFQVGIHIADVSHYVVEGSPLDEEAYARATSVYLPGHVIPMLPEHLSNGVCSLVPGQDRLTLSVLAQLNGEGELISYQIAPSVIHSKARLTYDEVQAYSEASAPMPEHARHLEGDLHLLLKITNKMRIRRLREGSLDFKLREVKVEVDKAGGLTLIPIREETARGMIEDLMLLANQVVARHLLENHVPTLFRIHEDPRPSSFQEVAAKIARLGLVFSGNEPTPQVYQAVLKQARGTPNESFVNQMLLRSLQQARYSAENLGHFGLAFKEYLHFTSPIRRYPDLLVHRAVCAQLEGRMNASEKIRLEKFLPEAAVHTSAKERSATEAERDLNKYYQAKWAQAHLDEVFVGRINGMLSRGIFVELENGIEGLVHVSELGNEYFMYLEEAQMFKGRSSGTTFRFGDTVGVRIAQVNPLARQIDFALVELEYDMDMKPRARRPRRENSQSNTTASSGQASGQVSNQASNQASGQPSGGDSSNRRDNSRLRNAGSVEGQARPEARLEPKTDGRGDQSRNPRGGAVAGRGTINTTPTTPKNGITSSSNAAPAALTSPMASAPLGAKRRIVTLERSRNEHSRPVNVTVHRIYFGDWSVENLRDDSENEHSAPSRRSYNPRPTRNEPRKEATPRAAAPANSAANNSAANNVPRAVSDSSPSSADAATSAADTRRRRRRRRRRPGAKDGVEG